MRQTLLLTATVFCFSNLINAQAGKLDSSFGKYGIVTGINHLDPTYGYKLLTPPDGSMYIIYSDEIEKRKADGFRDFSYGTKGFSDSINMYARDAAFQSDGKIIVAGGNGKDFELERFNTNGSLDSSFSEDGIQTTDFASDIDDASAIAIQKDGKIVVAGNAQSGNNFTDFAIARYNKDGSPDITFYCIKKATTTWLNLKGKFILLT